ncbi:MAG: hypothetical protein LM590_00130 [Thermofilum sp.]|jgi:hypothetical protein|nr:hypothetical protein [Thermofilum sp.]
MRGIGEYKARKGLIRVSVTLDERGTTIREVRITGDFLMYPEEALWSIEEKLSNTEINELETKVRKIFHELHVTLVGSTVEDFLEAFRNAIENAEKGDRD